MTSEEDPDSSAPAAGVDHGSLPRWGQDDLPEPPPFSGGNLFRVIGPGVILLVASTGGGEWLVGPAVGVQYGLSVFWVVTIAVVLQVVFNLESLRYTLYTGEPMISGIMRLNPGSRFWAIVYSTFGVATLGLPSLAAASAAVLFAAFAGHMPLDSDAHVLAYVTYGVIAAGVGILLFGKTIERMLEHVSWFMLVFIFLFLGIVNVFFVPLSNWSKTFWGFLQFGQVPAGIDVVLLGALASSAGSGGIGNLVISNWARDKGFGMGAKVGAIGSAFGHGHITLSATGKIFPVTAENLRRWRVWWKYVHADQVWLWGTGAFLGMFSQCQPDHGHHPARIGPLRNRRRRLSGRVYGAEPLVGVLVAGLAERVLGPLLHTLGQYGRLDPHRDGYDLGRQPARARMAAR